MIGRELEGLELASKVSTKEPYFFGNENAKYKLIIVIYII